MMEGMLSGAMKRKRRGVPLRALTMESRAAGLPGLSEDQAEIVAAWLSLPKAQQRAIVVEIIQGGRDEMVMEDLPGDAAEEPVEEAPPPADEPVVVADPGRAQVLPNDEQQWIDDSD